VGHAGGELTEGAHPLDLGGAQAGALDLELQAPGGGDIAGDADHGAPAADEQTKTGSSRWWLWALVGAGATLAIGGAVLLITTAGSSGPMPSSDRVVTL